jgi:carboxyl-terminal processing protease
MVLNSLKMRALQKFGVVLVSALLIGACASIPTGNSLSDANASIIIEELNISFMAAVITQGFEEIRDRAFYEPDMDEIFVAALKELRRIDRDVSFEIVDDHIYMSTRNDSVEGSQNLVRENLGEAPEGDVTQWSLATINAILAARKTSALFRGADDEALYEALFNGAITKLDLFSRYNGPREAALSRLIRDGVIGLGVRVIATRGGALVQSIMVDGPAAKAGLLIDDLIVAADNIQLENRSLSDIRRRLEGRVEGTVELTIRRTGEAEDLVLESQRELIVADTVTSRVVDGVAELRIRSFNQRTAQAVEDAFLQAQASSTNELKGLVLDLRGDPGGLLDQAVAVADRFLNRGPISELSGRHSGANQSYRAIQGDITNGLPIVVVVDGLAASAAEIVAAALQGNDRAVIIGTVTLGKGSVQTIIRLHNNGELALTWSRAAAPNGIGLHGLGVLPDVCLSGEISPVESVVSKLITAPNPMASIRSLWLNPPQGSDQKMASLRDECPAETRTDRPLDLQVARRIASDPALLSIAMAKNGSQISVTH